MSGSRALGGLFDPAGRAARIAQLEEALARPGVWDDPPQAQRLSQELATLRSPLDELSALERGAADLTELAELAEGDAAVLQEVRAEFAQLVRRVEAMELAQLFSGRYDRRNCILSLHAGAGGTDAQDWVEMLVRMYTRWAEGHGFRVEVLDLLAGEEAGLKSATLLVRGENAYGILRAERGVHRLVRISPFDASGRRHTSFASVDVLPEIEDALEVDVRPEELRIDTFRSGGAGGQHVNKTESAVRITHLPTGIVVSCQNERSQHANRETAMKILLGKLLELKLEEKEREIGQIRGERGEIAWGSQIRSYVLQPYSLVKDHRTGVEVGNVQGVLDGDLDPFIKAFLERHR